MPALAQVQVPETITSKTLVSDETKTLSFSDGVFLAEDGDLVKVICSAKALLKEPQIWVLVESKESSRFGSRYDNYGRRTNVFKMVMLESACEAQVRLIAESLNSGQPVTFTAKGYEENHLTIEFN